MTIRVNGKEELYNRKYFNQENISIILKRLEDETNIGVLPTFPKHNSVEFGLGDICIEETGYNFIFYILDRVTCSHHLKKWRLPVN